VKELTHIAVAIKGVDGDRARANNVLRSRLESANFPESFFLPLGIHRRFCGFLKEECKVMSSNARPLWLTLIEEPKHGADNGELKEYPTMFKLGDDLRQDGLTMQVLGAMGAMWEAKGIDNKLTLYKATSVTPDIGFIELVPDSKTCAQITGQSRKAFSAGPLADYLAEQAIKKSMDLDVVKDHFARSCAGYCVGTYVLGIADRHNDNIMVRGNGCMFHIDFGHFLGNFLKFMKVYNREPAPFIFTSDFQTALGGPRSPHYLNFESLCVRSFDILRDDASNLVVLLAMMTRSGIVQLQSRGDLNFVVEALQLDLTKKEAEDHFKLLIKQSEKSLATQMNFFFHMMAQKMK